MKLSRIASERAGTGPRFTVIDTGYDEPAAAVGSAQGRPEPPTVEPLTGRQLSLRWCLAALLVSVLATAAAAGYYLHRGRIQLSTRVVSQHGQATTDLTSCPAERQCSYQDLPDTELFGLVQQYFPAARELDASRAFDAATGQGYQLSLLISVPAGITISFTLRADPTRSSAVHGWQSDLPERGPADVVVVRPGPMIGSSLAVTAHVPAGAPVPAAALARLLADPGLQQLQP